VFELYLVDIEPDIADALGAAFEDCPEVRVACGDILSLAENTVVSPANGFGFMDGGVDLRYRDALGDQAETEVRRAVSTRPEGYLPVGVAVLVRTGHARIPNLVAAPTMIGPGVVEPANSFFAMAAMLKEAAKRPDRVTKVFCPGLATGTGRVAPPIAAREMAAAYRKWRASVRRT
jgi:O-acetyl-ADP-ribose deacetylase (regulator of RNase III)